MIPSINDTLFLDTETTGLNPLAADFRVRMIGWLDGRTGAHSTVCLDEWDGDTALLEEFQSLLLHRHICAHNLHYDLLGLQRVGLELPSWKHWHCTLTLARLAAPRLGLQKGGHALKPLCVKLFDEADDREDQLLKEWCKQQRPRVKVEDRYIQAPAEMLAPYCLKDVQLCAKVWARFRSQLSTPQLASAYALEMELLQHLMAAEVRGLRLSLKTMRAADARLAELIASHSTTVYTLNGGEFNIGSPKQLAAALYKNGLPARFTKGGAPSTAKDALYKLAKGNPIAATVLKIRSCEKLRAYCSEFEEYRRGDLLSCVFHSLGARTGRMSSSNPNLQNIPRPDERSAALIRQFFIPHEGRRLVAADFSQIELRVGAMYAEDRAMLRAFNEGADIHIRSAEMMFGKVDKQSRQLAKAANFCLEYVGTADKLQEYLAVVCGVHVTYVDVCDIVKRWHAAFPGMRRLAHSVVAEVTLNGGVRDALGRFYPVPRAEAYKGVNYKVQGTCAWILKSAILRLAHLLPEYDSHFLSFIHDEVLIDAPAEHCELRKEGDEWSAPEGGFLDSVRLAMEDHRRVELPITTPVEVSVCDENWSRKRKVASYYLEVS